MTSSIRSERSLLIKESAGSSNRRIILRLYVFVSALSVAYAFTGVSMLYVVRQMTCDEYYKSHEVLRDGQDHCKVGEIESSAAAAISSLGLVTTIFAVVNLFYAKWTIDRFGFKWALVQQSAWPVLRLFAQIAAVKTGGYHGVLLMSGSQAISGLGGPQGYQLVANSYASHLASASEETAVFGRLQGCVMIGTAVGFVFGGWSGDNLGILSPFEIAVALTLLSLVFALAYIKSTPRVIDNAIVTKPGSKSKGFLGPLKVFLPRKQGSGRYYGLSVMGCGIFVGVLATGFNPILLQMYGTNAFSFTPSKNGYMMALNSLIRGGFLTFLFAPIINAGRRWYAQTETPSMCKASTRIPTRIADYETAHQVAGVADEPVPVPAAARQAGAEFDLVYLRCSMMVDSVLTGTLALVQQGWQLYGVACLLPFAAGSAPASKGIITEMCEPDERVEALSAMAVLETAGVLVTTSLTGTLFAVLSGLSLSRLTFAVQGAVGLIAIAIMWCARLPPRESEPKARTVG